MRTLLALLVSCACACGGGGGGDDDDVIDANPFAPDADPNAPDADPNAPDADPGAPDADTTISSDAMNECNGVVHMGPVVQGNRVASNRPNGTGGTITLGTYERVSHTIYTGAGGMTGPIGPMYAETILVTATEVFLDNSNTGLNNLNFSYTAPDPGITLTATCGTAGTNPAEQYTATSTTLTLYGTVSLTGYAMQYDLVP
jgi:hypothetical protein